MFATGSASHAKCSQCPSGSGSPWQFIALVTYLALRHQQLKAQPVPSIDITARSPWRSCRCAAVSLAILRHSPSPQPHVVRHSYPFPSSKPIDKSFEKLWNDGVLGEAKPAAIPIPPA
ncbi:hypothetical protein DPEC_G00176540 [Dallia pectoralis]|uniref:Uncharacterized protein n=1 Tax=Dallia pectoralis TaxID=75939 RepID=A0ACC2GF30_DALPE|nr:hypothetical protein DPEC_G00176540 [Dallia pectoralis]